MIDKANMPTAYAEALAMIDALGDEYKKQIPPDILELMERKKDKTFTRVFSGHEPNPKLSREALTLLAWLNLEYWCKDEDEKARLRRCYERNDLKTKLKRYTRLERRERENSSGYQSKADLATRKEHYIRLKKREEAGLVEYLERKELKERMERYAKLLDEERRRER